MRLFHVSEESDINSFIPRAPLRDDMDKSVPLVWAITERCLPNFLTPRDCPRVTYHAKADSTDADIARFFSSRARHVVAMERDWFNRMRDTSLYLYEFDPAHFYLQDDCAGYYVSERTEIPIAVTKIDDLFQALIDRNIEIRIIDNLWQLGRAVQQSTLNWSLCRMRNAKPM